MFDYFIPNNLPFCDGLLMSSTCWILVLASNS